MIVISIGYGYISKYLLKKIASDGVRCIGVTDNIKYIKKKNIENISVFPRSMTTEAIKQATHLVITAPPERNKCPILSKYKTEIKKSNIRAIVYVSSTGVYGDHKGKWVNENSSLLGINNITNKNRIKAENSWKNFCKQNLLICNIVRLGGIYGPGRLKASENTFKNIIIKKDHFFSRIHVLDISRLIAYILFNSSKNECWNLVDDLPTTRKTFVERLIQLKKVKNYNFKNYEDLKNSIPKLKRKFWEANKKVSNKKIKERFQYTFMFPSYLAGLKFTIKNSKH